MRILITGGTGFIGSRLALRCLKEGHSVAVLGQQNTSAEAENRKLVEDKGAKIILASITDETSLVESSKDIDVVYHLAATQHEMNVPDQKFWDVNVNGTRNMLEASIATGVKRFIYGSTIGVYGSLEGRIDENSPCQPDNIYGVTKLAAEKLALSYQDRISVVAVRISETYGPGDRRLLKLFKGIRKNMPFLIGDGQNIHHLVYIDDLIQGFLLAATVEVACGKVFVLAGKEPVTTDEMFTVIAEQLGVKAPTVRIPLAPLLATATAMETLLRPLGIQPPLHRRRMDFFKKSFSFSLDRGETVLGYRPQVDFSRGVLETANWYKQQGYLS